MTLCLAQSLVDTQGEFISQNQVKKYIGWYENGFMSATGKCFDIGMATRTALTIWKDFFTAKGEKKDDGLDAANAQLAGQVLIDKALKHEVCGPTSPTPHKSPGF